MVEPQETPAQKTLRLFREEPFRQERSKDSERTPPRQDVDRIVTSRSFARLGRVTQVILAHDTLALHNRYTHSIRVAYHARRIAERLLRNHGTDSYRDVTIADHLCVDVVEAAALAHDIGHPPFAHTGEKALEKLVNRVTLAEHPEGYEGNAQTFRHLTRLAESSRAEQGLGLTRATLRAVLKYPFDRKTAIKNGDPRLPPKFGAYEDDRKAFVFAMEYGPPGPQQSLEASVMDLADDITYGVDDLEDFYRAGLIPMDLIRLQLEISKPIKFLRGRRKGEAERLASLLQDIPLWSEDESASPLGSNDHPLTRWRFETVKYFMTNIDLEIQDGYPIARFSDEAEKRMEILQAFTSKYVHDSPNLLAQQAGLEAITTHLFDWLCPPMGSDGRITHTAHLKTISTFLPRWARRIAEDIIGNGVSTAQSEQWIRLTADVIASLDDGEAIQLARRIQGTAIGSLRDGVW